jgi:RsiG-like
MPQQRRRLDRALEPSFTTDLDTVAIEELRDRRQLLDILDTELSYYRRILHGRMDLLDFELRRRAGNETRSLIDALPEILADTPSGKTTNPLDRELSVDTPENAGGGRRDIDHALGDDFLARLPMIGDNELAAIRDSLAATERTVSEQRRAVHDAHDLITGELTRRYRDGLADADELLSTP